MTEVPERTDTDGGLDSTISRLSKLTWDSTVVETYEYLGLSTVIERDRPEADHTLTYVKRGAEGNGDAGDQYTGLDRFGRISDQRWLLDAGGHADRFQYGHDRNGNRLYEENLLDPTKSELYHDGTGYDKLDRLGYFARGTLDAEKDGLTGSASRSQDWNLDALGNWDSFTVDGGTAQTRTHDSQNRITAVSGATSPEHSPNGEMTRDETGNYLVYDAWGKLVEVNDGTNVISAYAYDAVNRRITHDDTGLYYSAQWQVLEDRDVSTGAVEGQYVWSDVYVDALILRDRDTDANGSLEERLYVTHDANFNVTSVIGLDGSTWEVIERYVYDPYGERTVLNADWTVDTDGLSDVVFVHGHQGGRHDLAVGLMDFRNRFLDTSLGRWTRQDPLGYIDGSNRYSFTRSSPLVYIDSQGLTCGRPDCSDCWTTCMQNQGLIDEDVLGAVICRADGCQCACANISKFPPIPFAPTPADDILFTCVLVHEEDHVDHPKGDCSLCNPKPCLMKAAPGDIAGVECSGYAAELKCLLKKLPECRGKPPAECHDIVINRINVIISIARNDFGCKIMDMVF